MYLQMRKYIYFLIFSNIFPPNSQALAEHDVEIPETINTQTLVKDLAKEIRLVEVNIEQ